MTSPSRPDEAARGAAQDPADPREASLRQMVRDEFAPLFSDMRQFVDRRIAELSAEINATVQLVDYSETNLSGQLARVHELIVSMVAVPAAATRNSGLELEAVVQATEAAANRIMEAAEAIGDWVRDGRRDPESLEAVAERVSTIFEACTFQDITGQRIRRAIEHLQRVETMLIEMVPDSALPSPPTQVRGIGEADEVLQGPDLAQNEVDRLFG